MKIIGYILLGLGWLNVAILLAALYGSIFNIWDAPAKMMLLLPATFVFFIAGADLTDD